MLRVGIGYDIHRAVPGKGLKLGGVAFPRAGFRLEGHSDADVVIHAVCDALLGAAGLPDIGHYFPNTSSRHRGRNSLEFLKVVGGLIRRRGFSPVNVDCTLLAENPKIGSCRELMKTRMSRALGVTPDAVQVKATTNEKLGTIGRGEGLAAMAVALLEQVKS